MWPLVSIFPLYGLLPSSTPWFDGIFPGLHAWAPDAGGQFGKMIAPSGRCRIPFIESHETGLPEWCWCADLGWFSLTLVFEPWVCVCVCVFMCMQFGSWVHSIWGWWEGQQPSFILRVLSTGTKGSDSPPLPVLCQGQAGLQGTIFSKGFPDHCFPKTIGPLDKCPLRVTSDWYGNIELSWLSLNCAGQE